MANYTITITGSGRRTDTNVKINGTSYYQATTLSIEEGTEVVCSAQDVIVVTDTGDYYDGSYTFTVSSNTEVRLYTTDMAITHGGSQGGGDTGHRTMVNGVQRLVTNGLDLVSGVQRRQVVGLTLVNGVRQVISFALKTVTVKIHGSPNLSHAYIKIGGTKIYKTGTTVYDAPLAVTVHVGSAFDATEAAKCYVNLNGTKVKSGSGDYTFTTEAKTLAIVLKSSSSGKYYYAKIIEG